MLCFELMNMFSIGRVIGRARWLPFGIRDRILQRLFPPQRRLDLSFVTNLGRSRFAGNIGNYIDWRVYFFGSYEAGMLLFLERLIESTGGAPVLWDIGANCGQHTIFVASLGECGGVRATAACTRETRTERGA